MVGRRSSKQLIRRRFAVVLLALLSLTVAGFAVKDKFGRETTGRVTNSSSDSSKVEEKTKLRLLATGDFIAHEAINLAAKTQDGYDYTSFVADMKPVFATSDINFCNQATQAAGQQFGVTGYPSFNAPSEWVDMMSGLGCNVINTASNHSFDRGQRLIDANVDLWSAKNALAVVGQNKSNDKKSQTGIFEVNGVRFGFLAYTTYSNIRPSNDYGVNSYSRQTAEEQIKSFAESQVDIVIVSMRWGTEYSSSLNEFQKTEAQYLSNLGVDLILGHGPHVLQPFQRIESPSGETHVWYSLGNFLNAQLDPENLFNCLAVMEIDIASKKIITSSCLPIYMHYEWTKEQKKAQDLTARRNFRLLPEENAGSMYDKALLDKSPESQTDRLTTTLSKLTSIKLITLEDYGL
jgi:poly-gamma-glutamate capsule biosynthesis protein CapA/YwtB (metallophosphatase superfamily)